MRVLFAGTRLPARGCFAVALALSLLVASEATAAGPAGPDCYTAYEQAQRLRKAGKLRASHEQLVSCMRASCPEFIRSDCTTWLDEVEDLIPAIVVTAVDARGQPTDRVAVYVDGERIATHLDGRGMAVDPGPHTMRYELDGRVLDDHVVVPEGSRAFPLVADFRRELAPAPVAPKPTADVVASAGVQPKSGGQVVAAPADANGKPQPAGAAADDTSKGPPATEGADRGATSSHVPLGTYLLGGVALAGAGFFTGFAIAGKSTESCAPNCSDDQIATLRREFAAADISLGVAVAAAGGALFFALTARAPTASATNDPPTSALWIGVRPEQRGASLSAGGRF